MSSDSMGNLEKLGILVIVILVVVVGVVAITPSDTLFPETLVADLPGAPGSLEPLPPPAPAVRDDSMGSDDRMDTRLLDPWPDNDRTSDETVPAPRPKPVASTPVPPRPVTPRPVTPRLVTPRPGNAAPVTPLSPPSRTGLFREVTVRNNDNMWRIAARELGAGRQWKRIASANPSVDPDRLREGQVLRIPTADAPRPETPGGAAAKAVSTTGSMRYVVQGGDTPMGLSKKFYGTTRHFRELLRANGLDEANDLLQGMTIEIPVVPTTSSDPAPQPPAAGERTYVVRKGDTPSGVAREQLDDATRWREILDLNEIRDDRGLMAGTRIRLPR